MRAAICEIELYIPAANSLKAKRQVVKSVIERLKARCNASVAETGYQDVWQRSIIGMAIVAGDWPMLEKQVTLARRIVDDIVDAEVTSFDVEYV